MNTIFMAEQLEGEYREVFEKANLYACVKGIGTEMAEDRMMNLFDLLLTAQNHGKPVEKVIGKDVERFCNDYFEDYGIRERIKLIPEQFYSISWFVITYSVLELLLECDMDQGIYACLGYRADIFPYIVGLFVGAIFSELTGVLLGSVIFRFPRIAPMKYYIGIIITFVVMILVAVFWVVKIQIDVLIPVVPMIGICMAYVVVYWGNRAYKRYCHHGSIRKEKKEEGFDTFLSQKDSEELLQEAGASLLKRYHIKNKRRKRQGKESWTIQEYMAYLSAQEAKEKVVWRVLAVLYFVIIIVPVGISLVYESIFEALIVGIILSVIVIPIYFLLKKLSSYGAGMRNRLIKECNDRGITLLEYVKNAGGKQEENFK